MKNNNLILPQTFDSVKEKNNEADSVIKLLVSEWINTRAEIIAESWSKSCNQQKNQNSNDALEISNEILKIITHRIFNFQSKRNLIKIIPHVEQIIINKLGRGASIKFFFLYNGGYRASPLLNGEALIFEPDHTELILLYQITLLSNKIRAIYNPGIEFSIVINNGVSKWVNDIPISASENYAKQLRKMIAILGAEKSVKVLLQSEQIGFDPSISFESTQSGFLMSERDHFMVERFLGRSCSVDEAAFRSALYKFAESRWSEDLSAIIASDEGIIMRQVAHPEMLSFRPFPGGAIRIQNGTLGFECQKNILKPKLITSKNVKENDVKCVPYLFPLEYHKIS
jgi:hypothetical protein